MLESAHVLLEAHVLFFKHCIHGLDLHHLPLASKLEVGDVNGDVLWQSSLALKP